VRRALPVVLSALLALSAAGCSTSSEADVVPVRDVAPTKAQAQAAGKAINLVVADLPLYRGKRNKETARVRAHEAELYRCLGLSNPQKGVVADVESLDFTKMLREELDDPTLTLGAPRLTKVTTTLPDTEGLRGYDLSFPLSGSVARTTVELSILAFAVKHCEVGLIVADIGAPFPRDQRDGSSTPCCATRPRRPSDADL